MNANVGAGNTYIGRYANSSGTYSMMGGTLNVNANMLIADNASATGMFNQSGGEVKVTGNIQVGTAGTASISISAGNLTVGGNLLVGDASDAPMTISGGFTRVSGTFAVGMGAGVNGSVTMSGFGAPNVQVTQALTVGEAGIGLFNQSVGTVHVLGDLLLGNQAGSAGSYDLSGTGVLIVDGKLLVSNAGTGRFAQSGGEISAVLIEVGDGVPGTFVQTGGTNDSGALILGTNGLYDWQGGDLNLNSLFNLGTMDLNGQALTLNIEGIFDQSNGSFANSGSATLNMGANSLLLIASGQTPGQGFGAYTGGGLTHTKGTPLVLGTGEGFSGVGQIGDHVTTDGGDITAAPGAFIDLTGGLTQSGGTVDLGYGILEINDTSSVTNGVLSVGDLWVGHDGVGSFTQTNSNVSVTNPSSFVLGSGTGDYGTYTLASGTLAQSGAVTIGDAGTGVFTQTGGVHTSAQAVNLALQATGIGSYDLSDGRLVVSGGQLVIGNSGLGVFVQSGGTVDALYRLATSYNAGSVGTYILSGGVLNSGQATPTYQYGMLVGRAAEGLFIQTGGTVNTYAGTNADGALSIGPMAGAAGTYRLSGTGVLNLVNDFMEIGRASGSVGVFEQSGGQVNAGTSITLATNAGAYGQYTLSGGTLNVTGNIGTGAGESRFNYDGGTLNVGGGTIQVTTFALANGAGSASFSLDGSPVVLLATDVTRVGGAGTGTFTLSGGTHSVGLLTINSSSTYLPLGGALDLRGGIAGEGTFDLNGATAAFSYDNLLVDLSDLTVANASGITATIGANSLVLVRFRRRPAGELRQLHRRGQDPRRRGRPHLRHR